MGSIEIAHCPDHPKLASSGACERCGRFICAACDPLNAKRCEGCRNVATQHAAAAPWRARQKRAAGVLVLGSLAMVASLWLWNLEHDRLGALLALSLGMCLGGVAAVWGAIAWTGSRTAPSSGDSASRSIQIAGGGCLLALIGLGIFVCQLLGFGPLA